MSDYDVVTIGSGLGGLTAGPFAARYRLSTLVLESNIPGGHLISIEVNGTARSLRCWRHPPRLRAPSNHFGRRRRDGGGRGISIHQGDSALSFQQPPEVARIFDSGLWSAEKLYE